MWRDITKNSVEKFKEHLSTVDWNLITQILNPNNLYNIFIDKFLKIYDQVFPLQKINENEKSRQSLDRNGHEKIIKIERAPL